MIDEANNAALDALSILEQDLSNQETTFPVLEPGTCDFVISDAKLEPTKTGSGYMLNLKLKTVIPYKTTTNLTKPPGFPFRAGIFIPSGKAADDQVVVMSKTKLAQLKESAFGTKEGAFGKPEQYIGRTITARISVKVDVERGPQNEIQAFVKRS